MQFGTVSINTVTINVACVMDRNVVTKEKEEINKYMDLTIELQRILGTTFKMILFGALGAIYNNLFTHMASLPFKNLNIHQLQEIVILRTATIIRRHLSLPSSG